MASFTHCADTERVHQMAEALDTVQGVLSQKFFDFLVAVDVYFPNFTDEELTWAISLLSKEDKAFLEERHRTKKPALRLVKG